MAGPLEEPGQRVAVDAPTGRRRRAAGPVGLARHELDVDLLAAAEVGAWRSRPRPAPTTSASTSCSQVGRRWKLTNPGPAISTALDVRRRVGVEALDELGGELARVATGRLGRGQRDVGRPVAVLAPGRPLEVDRRRAASMPTAARAARRAVARESRITRAFYRWSRALTRSTRSSGSNGLVT